MEYEMQRGVFRVSKDASSNVAIGQLPGNDNEFFSDMHRCSSRPLHIQGSPLSLVMLLPGMQQT